MNRVALLGRTPPGRTLWIVGVSSLALHLLWLWGLATTGGDLAAQDFWAQQGRAHPEIAYNFAWYGGLHPVSYSAITPYVMGHLGVRPTGVVCGVISSILVVMILRRIINIRHVFWPSIVAMLALWCNTVSGRITFSFGLMFALMTIWVLGMYGISFPALLTGATEASPLGEAMLDPGAKYGISTLTKVDFISLSMALVLGTAGLPHVLMRFYTVRTAMVAR